MGQLPWRCGAGYSEVDTQCDIPCIRENFTFLCLSRCLDQVFVLQSWEVSDKYESEFYSNQ